jgi:hypothetical protein
MAALTIRTPAGKGGGLWTTLGTPTVFHNEGCTESSPKVYKVQMRPDPPAR